MRQSFDGNSTVPQSKSTLRQYGAIVIVALVAAFILKLFVVDAIVVPSHSMESTLLVGDYVFVNKLAYGAKPYLHLPLTHAGFSGFRLPGISQIQRGDVIVFDFPEGSEHGSSKQNSYFVKRCIACAGDEVMIERGVVSVNGKQLLFSPKDSEAQQAYSLDNSNYGPVVVPKRGDVIYLTPENYSRWEMLIRCEGHTVAYSSTSDISVDGVPAKSYTVEKNYLFVLGDNRSESYDSRDWGFLPEENVVGKTMMVYWSWNAAAPVRNLYDKFSSIRWNRIGTFIH